MDADRRTAPPDGTEPTSSHDRSAPASDAPTAPEAGGGRRASVRRLLPPLAALAIIAVLATAALTRGGADADPADTTGSPAAASSHGPITGVERRAADDPLALGRPDAPVVMVEYADYRCPFCAKFTVDTQPELVARYVDRGILRIEWRDFPIFGKQSEQAARAGRAAARQGRFWPFHQLVAEDAPARKHADLPTSRLLAFARAARVPDLARFRRDMASAAVAREVDADREQALSLGVSSTPAFVVNGHPMLGAQPQEEFVKLIERARDDARAG